MRLDRMLAMVVALLNRDRISAREMAERFEVSIRTIYRDIEAINMAGIPVVAHSGNGGGFALLENYRLNRQLLSPEDYDTILAALRGVNQSLHNRRLDSTAEKIRALLPRQQAGSRAPAEQPPLMLELQPWSGGEHMRERLMSLFQAIQEKHTVTFHYCNAAGREATRTVEPLTLIYRGWAWYLYAFCRLRRDFRFFKVTRLRRLHIDGERFLPRPAPPPSLSGDTTPPRPLLDLVLRFPAHARSVVEDHFEEECITMESDGSLTVRTRFRDDSWVTGYLLGFGDLVEVLAPSSVRAAIHDLAKAVAARHRPCPLPTDPSN